MYDIDNQENLFAFERKEMVKQYAKSGGITIEEHNRALKERADILLTMEYIGKEIHELLCRACDYHDLGKANPRMQERLQNHKLRFEPDREIPHNILSMYLIPKEPLPEYYLMLFVVGFHHDYGNVFQILQSTEKQCLAKELLAAWKCASTPGFKVIKGMKRIEADKDLRKKLILVKGLLHKCDYSASGNTEIEYPNDFLTDKLESFFQKNHYELNEMQQFCRNHESEDIMLVGQTGMGKTEAALLWIGDHKGFILLPVKTAINKMYDRIREDILEGDESNSEKRIGLLHSDAIPKLLENYANEKPDYTEMDVIEYNRQSRQLAMPITVSTIDQLFDFIFKYQTYELKLATLSYSKVVIDEIQLYGADLLADLIFGLRMIRELGGKAAITTATLAPFVKDLIEKEVGKFTYGVFCNKEQVRHKVKMIPAKINAEDVVQKFRQCSAVESLPEIDDGHKAASSAKGGKILVICNTIQKAQLMYHTICKLLGEENSEKVHLLHSKFIRQDRAKKEREICACGRYEHEENVIWISTSLVEASLDIDFDYLFTELQDISSLLQRLGRVNRKGKKAIEGYNCYIYIEIDEKYLEESFSSKKKYAGNSSAFIDRDIFELSRMALIETLENSMDGSLTEGSKMEMLDKYFTMERLSNTNYMRKYREQMKKLQEIIWYELDIKDVKVRDDIYTRDVILYDIYSLHREEIEASAEKMCSRKTDIIQKIKERNHIMQYTVSVQDHIVGKYHKAIRKGMAVRRQGPLKIGPYEKIEVIDCYYDDRVGFQEKHFEPVPDEPIFV